MKVKRIKSKKTNNAKLRNVKGEKSVSYDKPISFKLGRKRSGAIYVFNHPRVIFFKCFSAYVSSQSTKSQKQRAISLKRSK